MYFQIMFPLLSAIGNLRVDYIQPSQTLHAIEGVIFWLVAGQAGSELINCFDHHLVWMNVRIPLQSGQSLLRTIVQAAIGGPTLQASAISVTPGCAVQHPETRPEKPIEWRQDRPIAALLQIFEY